MKKLLLAMVLAALPLSAFADYDCSTKVSNVLVYSDGSVNVFFAVRNDYTYVCNVETPRLNVPTTTCAMWVAALMTAQKNNTNVAMYFSGNGSCATLPVYANTPAPLYIGLAP